MGIMEKVLSAHKTTWISDGISDAETKTTIELAKISAKIERCRLDLGMTQNEFAEYMGVTQSMVSKWESREYNFTIRSLNEICQKLNITLSMSMENVCSSNDYTIIKWDEEKVVNYNVDNKWMKRLSNKGAIA